MVLCRELIGVHTVSVYICTCPSFCVSVCQYIYVERERKRQRDRHKERDTQRERQTDRERAMSSGDGGDPGAPSSPTQSHRPEHTDNRISNHASA